MPGLHFFSGQVSFTHPTPLLAVSILYVSAAHYPSSDLASFQPVYFRAFARAVGALTRPDLDQPFATSNAASCDRFDDVLGIILVGLLAIGWVDTVGMWVNVAYRLLLDGMAMERGKRLEEWKGLWEGLRVRLRVTHIMHWSDWQTIELEHSSLHLVCPALPTTIPRNLPSTREEEPPPNAAPAIGELLAIMQARMPRFVGRGLPTVWETVCAPNMPKNSNIHALVDDVKAIRLWASEIEKWHAHHAPKSKL